MHLYLSTYHYICMYYECLYIFLDLFKLLLSKPVQKLENDMLPPKCFPYAGILTFSYMRK